MGTREAVTRRKAVGATRRVAAGVTMMTRVGVTMTMRVAAGVMMMTRVAVAVTKKKRKKKNSARGFYQKFPKTFIMYHYHQN